MSEDPAGPLTSALTVARVRAVRLALLHLHKTLLDAERARFERERGTITGPGHALKLVMEDPFFAWLKPLSALIVQIDERLAEDAPVTPDEGAALLAQTRTLLQGDTDAPDFQAPYHAALQHLPDAVITHGRIVGLIGEQPRE